MWQKLVTQPLQQLKENWDQCNANANLLPTHMWEFIENKIKTSVCWDQKQREEKLKKPRLDLHPWQAQQYPQILLMQEQIVEICWDQRVHGDENQEQQQSLHLALLYKMEN